MKRQLKKFNKLLFVAFERLTHRRVWSLAVFVKDTGVRTVLTNPPGVGRADPYAITFDKQPYVFFEEYDVIEKHSYICVGKFDEQTGRLREVSILVDTDNHVSFPFVFYYEKDYYLILEESRRNVISLYKFTDFPRSIVFVKDLLTNVKAFDSSIIERPDGFYLFTSHVKERKRWGNDNLAIYFSPNFLTTNFHKVGKSFQKLGMDSRNAGAHFLRDGRLYRPSQDSTKRYGHHIVINEVLEISKCSYRERAIERIYPKWPHVATHTYNHCGNLIFTDVKSISYRLSDIIKNIRDVLLLVFGILWRKFFSKFVQFFIMLLIQPTENYFIVSNDTRRYVYNAKYFFKFLKSKNIECYYLSSDAKEATKVEDEFGRCVLNPKKITDMIKIARSKHFAIDFFPPMFGMLKHRRRTIVGFGHAIPFKKTGLGSSEAEKKTHFYRYRVWNASKLLTYFIIATPKLKELMPASHKLKPEKIVLLGQPKLDFIYQSSEHHYKIKEKLQIDVEFKNIILYAPTFRQHKPTQWFPFPDMDEKKFTEFLTENQIVMLLRPHELEQFDVPYNIDRTFVVNYELFDDILPLLSSADLLITDYSGVFVEFLVTDKPMIFLPYDKDEYALDRGFWFEYNQVIPGPQVYSFEDFCSEIVQGLTDPTVGKFTRDRARSIFLASDREGNCERILDLFRVENSAT
jgi:CDP-glycerol glycerophosphotransferase